MHVECINNALLMAVTGVNMPSIVDDPLCSIARSSWI